MRRSVIGFIAGIIVALGVALPALPTQAVPASNPGPLTDCFGHNGVQFGSNDAYLCEVKLGNDPSGGLYFIKTLDQGLNQANPSGQMFWYKLHPAAGNFYMWQNYNDPWGGSSPRANARLIAIDEGPAGECVLNWPSWTVFPIECAPVTNGGTIGPEHPLTPTEKSSVAEYIKVMQAEVPLSAR